MKFISRLSVYFFVIGCFITSTLTVENTKKCLIMKNNACVTIKSEVIGVNRDESNQIGVSLNFNFPINRCKPEDCKFCCLGNNKCGKKNHCESAR